MNESFTKWYDESKDLINHEFNFLLTIIHMRCPVWNTKTVNDTLQIVSEISISNIKI